MSALKLFFCLLSENKSAEVSIHRDLTTIHDMWKSIDKSQYTGLIHIGFSRPKILKSPQIMEYKGKIVATIVAKWSLPINYSVSINMVGDLELLGDILPVHLVLDGFGYKTDEPESKTTVSFVTQDNQLTLVEAIDEVLNKIIRPINKNEIFAEMIEANLFYFSMKKPVTFLEVELDKYCLDNKLGIQSNSRYGKTNNNEYFLLDLKQGELKGWVLSLSLDEPTLYDKLKIYGVFDEESYINHCSYIPKNIQDKVELFNFDLEKNNANNVELLLNILPKNILLQNINSLGLPVRTLNVFNDEKIVCLKDLVGVSSKVMMTWPNLGKKSINDLYTLILNSVEKLQSEVALISLDSIEIVDSIPDSTNAKQESDRDCEIEESDAYKMERISLISLKEHFEKTLLTLKERDRKVIEYRTGYNGEVKTLNEVGEMLGSVTRERIRQIQKKYVTKIIETEYWDDCIAIKIGQLLAERSEPLYLETLEIEDSWFKGFSGNYKNLVAIIELFSENEIKIIRHHGANIVSRINQDSWDICIKKIRISFKTKAEEGSWTRSDLLLTIDAILIENSAKELCSLVWNEFSDSLKFDGVDDNSILVSFGKSAESAVEAVLNQAESPLHYSEVAKRASELFGKEVMTRLAHNALPRLGAKLFGRGIYGLEKFNPISDRMCNNIQLVVSELMYKGPVEKQWHANEILNALQQQFSALPKELDIYILSIILGNCEKLIFLNRMVWARKDSGQTCDDRVDLADAFTKILEDNGEPLNGSEIKKRLVAIRGVQENLQLQPTDRMIQIGPNYWGLIERDVGGTVEDNKARLDCLFKFLNDSQKGVHVSEVEGYLISNNFTLDNAPSSYALLNLAQRDERFYLGHSMFLGLSDWDGETHRLNYTQAVKQVLLNMEKPMSITAINLQVEDFTGLKIDGSVTGLLINEGGVFNPDSRMWFNKSDA